MKSNKTKQSLTLRQMKMLKALQQTQGNVSKALPIAGIARSTYYEWLDNSPEFRYALRTVHRLELDECMEEIKRRAVDGVPSTKFYKGVAIKDPVTKKPYIEREYSDSLLRYRTQILARKLELKEYEDRQQIDVELSGSIKDRIDRLAAAVAGEASREGTGETGAGVCQSAEAAIGTTSTSEGISGTDV